MADRYGFNPSAPGYPPSQYPPPSYPPSQPQYPSHHHHHQHNPPHFPPQPPSFAPPPPHGGTAAQGYYWVDTTARQGVPPTAVHGGVDQDGTQIYVGRAHHDGDWIPAKVIPQKRVAYIAYNGKEISKNQFQVLCEQRFDWVPSHGGHIPAGAVEGGRTKDGESLYIGRVHHQGSQTVGKVHPSHRTCYISFGGREIGYKDYEILILRG